MSYDFLCPHCGGYLRIGDNVVLTVKKEKWSGGLVFLHPELGNYTVKNHPSFKVDKGEQVIMHCPVCGKNLTSKKHPKLAMLMMKDEEGKEHEIYFSQVPEEQSTFRLIGDFVEIHGEDAGIYEDLFDLSRLI